MFKVQIIDGFYRNTRIVEQTFDLVKPWKIGTSGGFVTVKTDASGPFAQAICRIRCEEHDVKYFNQTGDEVSNEKMNATGSTSSSEDIIEDYFQDETEEQTKARIANSFELVEVAASACAEGMTYGLIISGPPGIGKTHSVIKAVEDSGLVACESYELIKGTGSALGLYKKLYEYSEKGYVLILDDADEFLNDPEALNLLKAVLDTSEHRHVSWLSESRALKDDGVPTSFVFKGSIIFLTNLDFERAIASRSKLGRHLEALMSRCHYMNMDMYRSSDIIIRIKQVIDSGMLARNGLSPEEVQDVTDFFIEHYESMRSVDLRTVIKIGQYRANLTNWREMTAATCFTKNAKFKFTKDNQQ